MVVLACLLLVWKTIMLETTAGEIPFTIATNKTVPQGCFKDKIKLVRDKMMLKRLDNY